MVKGNVIRRMNVTDTTSTHLDVTLYNEAGTVLRRTVDHFEPRQLHPRFRRPGYGDYKVMLGPLPASTVQVEVRAHEGPHGP